MSRAKGYYCCVIPVLLILGSLLLVPLIRNWQVHSLPKPNLALSRLDIYSVEELRHWFEGWWHCEKVEYGMLDASCKYVVTPQDYGMSRRPADPPFRPDFARSAFPYQSDPLMQRTFFYSPFYHHGDTNTTNLPDQLDWEHLAVYLVSRERGQLQKLRRLSNAEEALRLASRAKILTEARLFENENLPEKKAILIWVPPPSLERMPLSDPDNVIDLAIRYKTGTEGWLPGESIQGIALYSKIRPRTIIENNPEQLEYIWIVRFGRHSPGDPAHLVRTTQEFWISAASGAVRAILPPANWPIPEPPPVQPDKYLQQAVRRQVELVEKLNPANARPIVPIACEGDRGPSCLKVALDRALKPFPSTDFLLTFNEPRNLASATVGRGLSLWLAPKDFFVISPGKFYSLSLEERLLFEELEKSKVPSIAHLEDILDLDTSFWEDDGILVRCMSSDAITLWLIRLGRHVDGFGEEGDLVWIISQGFNPLPGRPRIYWEPCLYRQLWVNSRNGKIFSVLSVDPNEPMKRTEAKTTEEWLARYRECHSELKIKDREWLNLSRLQKLEESSK